MNVPCAEALLSDIRSIPGSCSKLPSLLGFPGCCWQGSQPLLGPPHGPFLSYFPCSHMETRVCRGPSQLPREMAGAPGRNPGHKSSYKAKGCFLVFGCFVGMGQGPFLNAGGGESADGPEVLLHP